jgi:ribulose-phosphate 3-epimerase
MTEIIPAILTNDIDDFRTKYGELLALSSHFKKLHVDFADGEFVDSKTIMPEDLFFWPAGNSPFELIAHFMTFNPDIYFGDAKKAGFSSAIVHFEALISPHAVKIVKIAAKKFNLKLGLCLNPETKSIQVEHLIADFDFVQLMGIKPGVQGREFLPQTLDKIKELRALHRNGIICVDGGIKVGIARQCAQAGANQLVAGSAILKAQDEEAAIEALKEDIEIKNQ